MAQSFWDAWFFQNKSSPCPVKEPGDCCGAKHRSGWTLSSASSEDKKWKQKNRIGSGRSSREWTRSSRVARESGSQCLRYVATVLGSIPVSSDAVESEGRQKMQCRLTYTKKENIQKSPLAGADEPWLNFLPGPNPTPIKVGTFSSPRNTHMPYLSLDQNIVKSRPRPVLYGTGATFFNDTA